MKTDDFMQYKSHLHLCGERYMIASSATAAVRAEAPQFKNGPYLLAPKTNSMVIAWESTISTAAVIAYGTAPDALCAPITVEPTADVPDFQGVKMQLYRYKVEHLTPGQRYFYKVKLANGASCLASFRTLSEKSEKINLISLSDSHVFATRRELDAAVKCHDPDMILHCGDIVEGTGAQAEQFSFWLQGSLKEDFIHAYPVVYASGNHDQGGDYFKAYVYQVQDAEYGAEVEGDSSFAYGNMHIITMNSSPWGLFQMNAEATGNQAEPATMNTITRAMAWLRKDLETEAAKGAEFRLIFMHHPLSDAYTKRYIPDVIEPGNVDLLLSGHTHTYACTVSENPAVGAGTVYLTHQDARTYHQRGDFFHLSGTFGHGLLTVENYGAEAAGQQSEIANRVAIGRAKQQLFFSNIIITPREVLFSDEVTISAEVKNQGKGIAAALIPVLDNGRIRYLSRFMEEIKIIEPGASVQLTGTLNMDTLGIHLLQIQDQAITVKVNFRPAAFAYGNLRTKLGDGAQSDLASNILHVKAEVSNIGNEAGIAAAELTINERVIFRQEIRLMPAEKKTVAFCHRFDQAGEYLVAIGDARPQTIYIEGSIQGMPILQDKSGNGNIGYIHGAPKLGRDDSGRQTLILDGRRDYIEVPDRGGYTVTDGLSGMVWAHLPSAGTTKAGVSELTEPYVDLDGKGAIPDHNPLMVKGIGLGWGTPFLFRMAVRENGKVTYGVCLLDDNGEYIWNDGSQEEAGIKKDLWVQYTSTFDFISGGDAYQNGYQSAHVDKPAFTAPLKNWPGAPLYIGLGFKNTLLSRRNRAMYHTMLPGAISQVRFYDRKISGEENDEIRDQPTAAGPSAKHLKIWFDAERENIETCGTHTTEWVPIVAAPEKLCYDAVIKGVSSITVLVQISDDGKEIKEEKSLSLTDGQGVLDLTDLKKAKLIRIRTIFVSDLNETQSCVPILHTYVLTAGEEKTWNTLVDWNKGTFIGAAGHQSGDVYRNHGQDVDDYSDSLEDGAMFGD